MPGPKPVNFKTQHQCKPPSFSYYIGRLQRIYAGFNTNTSWLSLDHFFFTSVLQLISLKLFFFYFIFFFCSKKAVIVTLGTHFYASSVLWRFGIWRLGLCDLRPAKEICRRLPHLASIYISNINSTIINSSNIWLTHLLVLTVLHLQHSILNQHFVNK